MTYHLGKTPTMIIIPAALSLLTASTLIALRAKLLEESTNPNSITLADRAQAGTFNWQDQIRMRVESLAALTIHPSLLQPALDCITAFTSTYCAESYCEMVGVLDTIKEFQFRCKNNVLFHYDVPEEVTKPDIAAS